MNQINLSTVIDMSDMFKDCTSLTSIEFGEQGNPINQVMIWRYKESGFCKYNNTIILEFGNQRDIDDLKQTTTLVETVAVLTTDFEYHEELKTQFPELFI